MRNRIQTRFTPFEFSDSLTKTCYSSGADFSNSPLSVKHWQRSGVLRLPHGWGRLATYVMIGSNRQEFGGVKTLRAARPSRCEYSSWRSSPASEVATFESFARIDRKDFKSALKSAIGSFAAASHAVVGSNERASCNACKNSMLRLVMKRELDTLFEPFGTRYRMNKWKKDQIPGDAQGNKANRGAHSYGGVAGNR